MTAITTAQISKAARAWPAVGFPTVTITATDVASSAAQSQLTPTDRLAGGTGLDRQGEQQRRDQQRLHHEHRTEPESRCLKTEPENGHHRCPATTAGP